MNWKCPCCGYDANPETQQECDGGCGHVNLPRTVILVGEATGQVIAMTVDTNFGKYLLKSFAGEDANYASEPQFCICKDMIQGAWVVQHLSSAKNPTFCDGAEVGDGGCPLVDGSVLTIGPEKMRITLRLQS